jgi:hypothetical protein
MAKELSSQRTARCVTGVPVARVKGDLNAGREAGELGQRQTASIRLQPRRWGLTLLPAGRLNEEYSKSMLRIVAGDAHNRAICQFVIEQRVHDFAIVLAEVPDHFVADDPARFVDEQLSK